MFSDYSDAQLTAAGVEMASVAPNNDNDGVKEWRDLHADCADVWRLVVLGMACEGEKEES